MTVRAQLEMVSNRINDYLPGFDGKIVTYRDGLRGTVYFLEASRMGITQHEEIRFSETIALEGVDRMVNRLAAAIRDAITAIIWKFPPMLRPAKSGQNAEIGGGVYGEGRWL